MPVFAQDEGGGTFNVNDLFTREAADDETGAVDRPKFDPLADIRNWLIKSKAPPLEKKQEKPLNKLYEKEVKAMSKVFQERHGITLESALQSTGARGRGGRGGFNRATPEQMAEARKMSDQLVDKVIAGLRIDQQGALRRYQSEQLRVKRLNQFTTSMAAAGLPLTDDQKTEIETLYARESRLRTLIIVEAKGEPHQEQVSRLEAQTTQRVIRLLNPTQKLALAQAKSKSRQAPN